MSMFTSMLVKHSEQINRPVRKPPPKPARNPNQTNNIKLAHWGQTRKATLRYKAAMYGKGWMSTAHVEFSLGYAATTANPFLAKLLKLGRIERRPRGGAEKYNRRMGWDWRWKLDSFHRLRYVKPKSTKNHTLLAFRLSQVRNPM